MSTSWLLSACGSTGVSFGYGSQAIFDIVATIDDTPVTGFDIFPGMQRTLHIPLNQAVALHSSGSVFWRLLVGDEQTSFSDLIKVNNDIRLQTLVNTDIDLMIVATPFAPLGLTTSVRISLVATSIYEPSQTAQIDLIIVSSSN